MLTNNYKTNIVVMYKYSFYWWVYVLEKGSNNEKTAIGLGSEFEVHTFKNIRRPLKPSSHPFIASGKVSLMKSINLSNPSAENV